MRKQTFLLGRIFNIPIGLDYSWFLIAALITWSMATSYYPGEFGNWSQSLYWLIGAATAIMLFASVLLHELGHSLVALGYKIPVNGITLFIFGGIAEIGENPPSAKAEFWIALAGPAVSFALAIFFSIIQVAVSAAEPLFALVKYLAYINGALGLFNLIPGFPLDGGRVLRSVIWGITGNLHRATLIATMIGHIIAYLFIATGIYQLFNGSIANGIWIAFIGWFLISASAAELQRQTMQEQLADHTVAQVMNQDYQSISPEMVLQELVEDYILTSGQRCFVVEQNGEVVGLLTLHQIKQVPTERYATVAAKQAMLPLEQLKHTAPDTKLWDALQEMESRGVNQLPVLANGHIQGMLDRGDVISFLRTLNSLNYRKQTKP